MNIAKMMKQAQAMQDKMEKAQDKLAEIDVTGSAGNGLVSITMSCKYVAKSVTIDPKIIDADDAEMLEDLVLAAINDSCDKINQRSQEEMSSVSAGMQLPAGMKLPF